MTRYEIHFVIEGDDDGAVEDAVNAAYYLIESEVAGSDRLDAQAYRRDKDADPPLPTGWHDWDDEADETFYRRR